MKDDQRPASVSLLADLPAPSASSALEVNISGDLASVAVMHHGRKVTIMRNQDQVNSINPEFAKTSRKCPPFCIQPGELAPGVKTIAELEVLQFLKKPESGSHYMKKTSRCGGCRMGKWIASRCGAPAPRRGS